jgi:hypothetical protein
MTCPHPHMFSICENLWGELPSLPYATTGDSEDADTNAPEHAFARRLGAPSPAAVSAGPGALATLDGLPILYDMRGRHGGAPAPQ